MHKACLKADLFSASPTWHGKPMAFALLNTPLLPETFYASRHAPAKAVGCQRLDNNTSDLSGGEYVLLLTVEDIAIFSICQVNFGVIPLGPESPVLQPERCVNCIAHAQAACQPHTRLSKPEAADGIPKLQQLHSSGDCTIVTEKRIHKAVKLVELITNNGRLNQITIDLP